MDVAPVANVATDTLLMLLHDSEHAVFELGFYKKMFLKLICPMAMKKVK